MFSIKLWGVRGSIPCPGPETSVFGGNTACIEIRIDKRIIIIDAGSGIRALGNELVKSIKESGPVKVDLFITHTHWDHIMGFPFFTPIYIPGSEINVYGPVTYEDETLEDIIGGQLRYRYFPVSHNELAAKIKYFPLKECTMDLGDGIKLTTKYLNHPILCLGYKIEYQGKTFCTAYDTEPFSNVFDVDKDSEEYDPLAFEEGALIVKEQQQHFLDFIQGSDLLIFDAQYTRKEYKSSKVGWGHTAYEDVLNTAQKAQIKNLILFHHDPTRTDSELIKIEKILTKKIQGHTNMQIGIAKEQTLFDL